MKKAKFVALLAALSLTAPCLITACGSGGTSGSSSAGETTSDNQITVTLASSEIYVGATTTVSCTAGTTALSDLIYEIDDESIATISGDTITALKVGSTTIKAKKAGYKAGTATLTVVAAPTDYQGLLEFENATHYSPEGQWGNMYSGYQDSPVETNDSSSGGKSVGYQSTGCIETITFTSDVAASVRLGFVMASTLANYDYTTWQVTNMSEMDVAANLTIKVNGTSLDLTGKTLQGTESGQNYYNWDEFSIYDVSLTAGTNTIEVTTTGTQGPNMDCVHVYGDVTIEQIAGVEPTYENIGSYTYNVSGYEFGPGVDSMTVDFGTGNTVLASDLKADKFAITVSSQNGGATRVINDVYLSDTDGNKISDSSGTVVTFDLDIVVTSAEYYGYISTTYNGASPFYYDYYGTGLNTWDSTYALTLRLASGATLAIGSKTYTGGGDGFEVTTNTGKTISATKDWGEAKSNTYDGKTLTYKAYETSELKNDSGKNPLIIWLHGAGEGGTDPDIAILGNDVTNLGEEKIQSYFKTDTVDGAYVLAVQTPTMWMDDGTGTNTGGIEKSIYTEVLKDTIDTYITENGDIDTTKIYLGGCSNGGYMTMNMAKQYGSFFKGYYPICEAYSDSFLSDDDITAMKDLNIWFTASADDTTVAVSDYTNKAYSRLMAAGAKNVHYSLFETVIGTDTGEEVRYMGHWSWIYTLTDRCLLDQADYTNISAPSTKAVTEGDTTYTLWSWLASK